MRRTVHPEAWGLHTIGGGRLALGNHGLASLAAGFGTPLHVINESRLMKNAAAFREEAERSYPGRVSVCYAMKCNSVPSVVEAVLRAGPGLEVMTEYELELALRLGCAPENIIVNGPCKTAAFIDRCIDARVRLIIVDSIPELLALDGRSRAHGIRPSILLRVNPDFIPRGMNRGTATGSRKGCAFGLDLKRGEVRTALSLLGGLHGVEFRGFHMHIGTGIRRPSDYARALRCLGTLKMLARDAGLHIRILDVGGGYASPMTRELGTGEFLLSQALGRLRERTGDEPCGSPGGFARAIAGAVTKEFRPDELPEIVFEPGRSIASPAQFLLLTVHYVKVRSGAGRWLIADGGLSTVTLPTFYEYHEVLLCNDAFRPPAGRATIIGPACFAGDVVYRNKRMPDVRPGEVIALMDTGAYFTALESSFGFPHPAIVSLNGATCRLVRTRETFDEMIRRDVFD
jgi:diaminopimelate decarboxylase